MKSTLVHIGALLVVTLGLAFISLAPGWWRWVLAVAFLLALAIALALLKERR